MKVTVNAAMMKEYFINWDRDYYTFEALEALLEYYDEVDPDMELDIVGICCDWNEYGNTPCLKWEDFLSDYGYILEEMDKEAAEADEDEKIDFIVDKLEEKTLVIPLSDSVLVAAF